MMGLAIAALLLAFLGSICITLLGLERDREGWAVGGIAAMIFFGLQLGGAVEMALG